MKEMKLSNIHCPYCMSLRTSLQYAHKTDCNKDQYRCNACGQMFLRGKGHVFNAPKKEQTDD